MATSEVCDSLNTRGQNAYRLILEAIRAGSYRPGERLREEEVAKRLGMSRTPIREALGRLQEKGLVEGASGRGLAVSTLNMQQVLELYATRADFEATAARFAAQRGCEVEFENLEQINQDFRRSEGDPARAAHFNRLFHVRLYDAGQNRYLNQALDDLNDVIALLPVTTFVEEGRVEKAYSEHAEIIAGLRTGDPDRAYRAALNHIREALKARLRLSS
ncbi:MAG: GntR family transcriptional regulator [Salinarimonadaceae bacterium]|nr:MAG: GntR family transcriptional regulator [Salinarimonadaceae bacterium]